MRKRRSREDVEKIKEEGEGVRGSEEKRREREGEVNLLDFLVFVQVESPMRNRTCVCSINATVL